MKRRLLLLLACAATLSIAYVGGAAAVTADEPATGAEETITVPTTTAQPPSDDERRLADELDDLADAWASAGGTYGYPFWDKARQRWHAGEISPSLFREYVSGYRDRMHLGCELVDDVDTSSGIADDTHELVSHACDERVKGLEAQQRWLDELIDQPEVDPRDTPEEVATAAEKRDARLAELEADAQDHLQRSFRDTRRAMDLVQDELEADGLERLREDAFV